MAHTFIMPGLILSGDGAVEQSMDYMPKPPKKALVVTSACNVEYGQVDEITEVLEKEGREYCIFEQVNQEPSDSLVQAGARLYMEEHCGYLIAIGGGSAIDVMKAIGLLVSNPGDITDYAGKKEILNPLPFMAAVPTTAGTGSEATQFTIITDTKRNVKMLIGMKELMPDLVLLIPKLTYTVPREVTVSTGMDALIHALEAFLSKKAQPLTDSLAISAVKRILPNLPRVYSDGTDQSARNEMACAALEAGIAFNNSSVTLIHGMSRPIGALFHVPHGLSNAMLLRECMYFMADSAEDRLAVLSEAVHAAENGMNEKEKTEALLKKLSELCDFCAVPTLEEYGVEKKAFMAQIDKMAEDALASGSPQNLRKTIGKEDIISIYQKLWQEERSS